VVTNASKRRFRTAGSMPGPLSETSRWTFPPRSQVRTRTVRSVELSTASAALTRRFNSTCAISGPRQSTAGIAVRSRSSSMRDLNRCLSKETAESTPWLRSYGAGSGASPTARFIPSITDRICMPAAPLGADELVELGAELCRHAFVRVRQPFGLDGAPDAHAHVIQIPGLENKAIDEAVVDRAERDLHLGVGGEQDAVRPRPALPDAAEKGEPVHLGHPLVGDDEVELPPVGDLEAPDRRGRHADVHVRFCRERALDQIQRERLVVDHQQAVGGPLGAHDSMAYQPWTVGWDGRE